MSARADVAEKVRVHTWREPVDGATAAAIAFCEMIYRGGYHRYTTFLLVDAHAWDWRGRAEAHFREQLMSHHGGHLPYICRASAL